MTLQAGELATHPAPEKLALFNRMNPHGKFQDTPVGGFDVQWHSGDWLFGGRPGYSQGSVGVFRGRHYGWHPA